MKPPDENEKQSIDTGNKVTSTDKNVSVIQRSVAFDLTDEDNTSDQLFVNKLDAIKNVKIYENENFTGDKENVIAKKEIVGILKPPNVKKECKSFPSLPDSFLRDLGLIDNTSLNTENMSEQDIENKFSSLSLAFKTDQVTLVERAELQKRQRDIAERNVEDEIRQLSTSVTSLNRVCQDSDAREVLSKVEKQVTVLKQSANRVCASAEQYGAVQQEARISTAIQVMLLHVDNLRRNYEKEHNELEETRRVLVEHKVLPDVLIETEGGVRSARNRSVSVLQNSSSSDYVKIRRATLATPSHKNLVVDNQDFRARSRSRSPNILQISNGSAPPQFNIEEKTVNDKKNSVFTPIHESVEEAHMKSEDNAVDKKDDNNNGCSSNRNTDISVNRRDFVGHNRTSMKVSTIDVNTIMEEIDDLEQKRDSSPVPLINNLSPTFPRSAKEFIERRKSLMIHISDWYSELYWPYDEEETILGARYCMSGCLLLAACAVLINTFIY